MRLGWKAGGGTPVKHIPPRKRIAAVDIEEDNNGLPVWPQNEGDEEWNLCTRQKILRDFVRAHYRKFFHGTPPVLEVI